MKILRGEFKEKLDLLLAYRTREKRYGVSRPTIRRIVIDDSVCRSRAGKLAHNLARTLPLDSEF